MLSQKERSLFPSCHLYHEEIGIHTLEFLYHFDPVHEKDVMNWIWNSLLKNAPHRSDKTGLANLAPGLNAQIFRTNAGFFLKMIVNPRVMVDGKDGYLGITDCGSNTLGMCRKKFDRYWKQRGIRSIRMKRCNLSRVDLCMSIEFDATFSVPMYLDLLKRTPHDGRYGLQTMENPEDDLHIFKIANGCRALVVYDKLYEQRRFAHDGFDCENLMRIEYQMYSKALYKLRRKQTLENDQELLGWMMAHVPEILCKGIAFCLVTDPYVNAEKIRACIQKETGWRQSTKDGLRQMQRELYRAKNYDEYLKRSAISVLSQEGSDDLPMEAIKPCRLDRKLKCYRDLKLCPACLRKGSGRFYLPSLYQLVCSVLSDHEKQCRAE